MQENAIQHFRRIYETGLEAEAQWLEAGARGKVDSIEMLLRRNGIRPRRILELGCGTGAVIQECRRRDLAEEYVAVDSSDAAIDYLHKKCPQITAITADITRMSFADRYDVVVLSHVLEHLNDPLGFFGALCEMELTYLITEVPLEDMIAGKVKAHFGMTRSAAAGHVQFFTARTFGRLLHDGGFTVVDKRRYVPLLTPRQALDQVRRGGGGVGRAVQVMITNRYLPMITYPLWARTYYAHYAVLAAQR